MDQKQKQTRRIRNEKGFAVVGMLIAIIIGMIMLAGVFVVVQQAMDNKDIDGTLQELATMRMGTKQMFSTESSFGALGTAGTAGIQLLNRAGIVPATVARSATVFRHAWDNNVTVWTNAANNAEFAIVLTGVPEAACLKLGPSGGGWSRVTVGGWATSVATVAAASANCAANNTMYFVSN